MKWAQKGAMALARWRGLHRCGVCVGLCAIGALVGLAPFARADAEPDTPERALSLTVGVPFQGTLGRGDWSVIDSDEFVVPTVPGAWYVLELDDRAVQAGLPINLQTGPDSAPALSNLIARLAGANQGSPDGLARRSSFVRLVPGTSRTRLRLRGCASQDGQPQPYSIVVRQVPVRQDDHAPTCAGATFAPDGVLLGHADFVADSSVDIDSFSVPVRAGNRYTVSSNRAGANSVRVAPMDCQDGLWARNQLQQIHSGWDAPADGLLHLRIEAQPAPEHYATTLDYYRIEVRAQATTADDVSGLPERAAEVKAGERLSGEVHDQHDIDCVRIRAARGRLIEVVVRSTDAIRSVNVQRLYRDANGHYPSSFIASSPTAQSAYSAKLWGAPDQDDELMLALHGAGASYIVEAVDLGSMFNGQGDTPQTALAFPALDPLTGGSLIGTLSTWLDVDHYSVAAPEGSLVNISTSDSGSSSSTRTWAVRPGMGPSERDYSAQVEIVDGRAVFGMTKSHSYDQLSYIARATILRLGPGTDDWTTEPTAEVLADANSILPFEQHGADDVDSLRLYVPSHKQAWLNPGSGAAPLLLTAGDGSVQRIADSARVTEGWYDVSMRWADSTSALLRTEWRLTVADLETSVPQAPPITPPSLVREHAPVAPGVLYRVQTESGLSSIATIVIRSAWADLLQGSFSSWSSVGTVLRYGQWDTDYTGRSEALVYMPPFSGPLGETYYDRYASTPRLKFVPVGSFTDEDEAGNSPPDGRALRLGETCLLRGHSATGAIDEDWLRLPVQGGRWYRMNTSPVTLSRVGDSAPGLVLQQQNGRELPVTLGWSSWDGGESARWFRPIDDGVLAMRFIIRSGDGLVVRVVEAPEERGWEPDDHWLPAGGRTVPAAYGYTHRPLGSIQCGPDMDWYNIPLPLHPCTVRVVSPRSTSGTTSRAPGLLSYLWGQPLPLNVGTMRSWWQEASFPRASTDDSRGALFGIGYGPGDYTRALQGVPYELQLRRTGCLSDVARAGSLWPDGRRDADDINAFVNAFFAGDHFIADVASVGQAASIVSINPDGIISTDDLLAFARSVTASGCN